MLFLGDIMRSEDYGKLVEQKTENSPILKDCVCAFVVGGAICCLGQGIKDLILLFFELDEETAGTWTTIILVFLSALFTGIGWYDKLAKHAGAGTLVPVTGFANAMASPAIEFKKEGLVLGIGPKLFTVAGSVIVYGTVTAFFYGIIYYIVTEFFV